MRKCPHCGFENADTNDYCDNCGMQLNQTEQISELLTIGAILNSEFEILKIIKTGKFINIYKARTKDGAYVLIKERIVPPVYIKLDEKEITEYILSKSNNDINNSNYPTPPRGTLLPLESAETSENIEISNDTQQDDIAQKDTDPDILANDILPISYINSWRREFEILKETNYPRFPKTIDLFQIDNKMYIILEYIEGQSLMERRLNGEIAIDEIIEWGIQICQGLKKLHQNNIIHKNLDPSNIIITSKEHISIVGFSRACYLNETYQEYLITEGYSPPEQYGIRGGQINKSSDLFALGGIFYYLLSGEAPPPSISVDALENNALELPDNLQPTLHRIIKKCRSSIVKNRYQDVENLKEELLKLKLFPKIKVGCYSDVGRFRKLNEDSLLCINQFSIEVSKGHFGGLYIVADGMGGASAGERASSFAVREVAAYLLKEYFDAVLRVRKFSDTIPELIKQSMQYANRVIYDISQGDMNLTGMGTTLTLALIVDNIVHIGHIGDSRAYILHNHNIKRITRDHSKVELLIERGLITPEQARSHPERNVIYRSMGSIKKVEIEVYQSELEKGDKILLCTDGLWDFFEDKDLLEILEYDISPQEATEYLINYANAHGGYDNITVIIIEI